VLLPVVENDCTDYCTEHDFFDLSYASLGQPKLNFDRGVLLLVVENDCTVYCTELDFFDFSYGSLGQPKLNSFST